MNDFITLIDKTTTADNYKPFYFIRHGQMDWNLYHKNTGFADPSLNETGRDQAKEAANLLKGYPLDLIISSPLLRAKETAEIIAERLKIPIKYNGDLQECYWGSMQGQPCDEDFYSN